MRFIRWLYDDPQLPLRRVIFWSNVCFGMVTVVMAVRMGR